MMHMAAAFGGGLTDLEVIDAFTMEPRAEFPGDMCGNGLKSSALKAGCDKLPTHLIPQSCLEDRNPVVSL